MGSEFDQKAGPNAGRMSEAHRTKGSRDVGAGFLRMNRSSTSGKMKEHKQRSPGVERRWTRLSVSKRRVK